MAGGKLSPLEYSEEILSEGYLYFHLFEICMKRGKEKWEKVDREKKMK